MKELNRVFIGEFQVGKKWYRIEAVTYDVTDEKR